MFGFWWGEGFLLGVVMVAVEWLLCSLRRVASLRCFGYWFAGVVYSVFDAIRFWWGLDGAKWWVGEREF